ncbi:RNA polymerase sigma factor [Actinomadura parmotrematis]|uniref:RNA polymerase sigma factor n=1 Tax=Actinomadura parmotrematis TaxID=2864039 RepID=UPI0027E38D02|nr:RNA polymerase sigma factor [Actinomadura parmotrematis]
MTGVPPDELDRAVQDARRGDEHAFRLLYRDLHPRLVRYATALAGADAEDVVAEAWLQIARDVRTFDGDVDGFRGWAATIVRHRALDHARRAARRPVADVPLSDLAGLPAGADAATLALEGLATREALRLIGELPPDQAEAVLLRVVLGLDAPTAARVLGKRAGAVRTAAHRGLRRLSDRLADGGAASGDRAAKGAR